MFVRNGARLAAIGLAFTTALAACGAADAAVLYNVGSAKIDPSAGSETGALHVDATSTNAAEDVTGQIGRILLTGTTSTGASFSYESFCVDIYDWLSAPATFTGSSVAPLDLTSRQGTRLTALLSNVDSFIGNGISGTNTGTTADRSAAAQLAVWEILYETSHTYDVDGSDSAKGSFYANQASGTSLTDYALSDASIILGDVKSGDWTTAKNFQVALLSSDNNQTQIVYGANAGKILSGVPEPATWGMMVIGFGAVGSVIRRRRALDTRATA